MLDSTNCPSLEKQCPQRHTLDDFHSPITIIIQHKHISLVYHVNIHHRTHGLFSQVTHSAQQIAMRTGLDCIPNEKTNLLVRWKSRYTYWPMHHFLWGWFEIISYSFLSDKYNRWKLSSEISWTHIHKKKFRWICRSLCESIIIDNL